MLKEYGAARPITKKIKITVTGATGITITFKALDGEAVLNAVQLKKAD